MNSKWDNKLNIGDMLIDNEHRILLLLSRKLDLTIKMKRPDVEQNAAIFELKKIAEFHFLSEENLMRETSFPGMREHAELHTELLMEFNFRMNGIKKKTEFSDDLLTFLNRWILQHIVTEDTKIAEFLKHCQSRPLAENLYESFLPAAKS